MSLIQPESDIDAMRDDVLAVAEATHHLAAILKARNERFWSQPTDRLLNVLNSDAAATISILATNEALGTAVNASLDALGSDRFPTRAPLSSRADITFDGTAFIVIPPIISEAP